MGDPRSRDVLVFIPLGAHANTAPDMYHAFTGRHDGLPARAEVETFRNFICAICSSAKSSSSYASRATLRKISVEFSRLRSFLPWITRQSHSVFGRAKLPIISLSLSLFLFVSVPRRGRSEAEVMITRDVSPAHNLTRASSLDLTLRPFGLRRA